MILPAPDPDPRRVADVALALACVTLLLAGGFAVWAWQSWPQNQWTPLGPFPEQEVISDTTVRWEIAGPGNTQDIPSIALSEQHVNVNGTKCYKEAVTVTGTVQWTSVEPPGRNWQAGQGTAVKQPGCATPKSPFENEIPPDVRRFVRTGGRDFVVVTISGCETPTDPDRGEGATLCWSTEPFALVP